MAICSYHGTPELEDIAFNHLLHKCFKTKLKKKRRREKAIAECIVFQVKKIKRTTCWKFQQIREKLKAVNFRLRHQILLRLVENVRSKEDSKLCAFSKRKGTL